MLASVTMCNDDIRNYNSKISDLGPLTIERVTAVKFRVNYGGGNGAGCFKVKVWADTVKFTDVIVARLRKCSDLIREGKVFVENKTKVASGVGCSERAVLYFRESNKKNSVLEELRVRRLAAIQEEICCRAFCK